MRPDDIGYLKEGFKLLGFAGRPERLCRIYEGLSGKFREIGNLSSIMPRPCTN